MQQTVTSTGTSFRAFYEEIFLAEHRHAGNRALHVIGVAAGLAILACAFFSGPLWIALLFPVVHALPGLLGHRLFERQEEVGDLRVTRRDYPLWWFIVANHRMALALLWQAYMSRRSQR